MKKINSTFKSVATAQGTVTVNNYLAGVKINSITRSLSITCSKTGTIS